MKREIGLRTIEIVQALLDGKSVQYSVGDGAWLDYANEEDSYPAVFQRTLEWRIKPEPRSLYALEFQNGDIHGNYSNRLDAEKNILIGSKARVVKFIEVTE